MEIDDIRRICVTGAGQMGAQIALQAALAGFEVTLHDVSESQLEKAIAGNRPHLERRVEKGKLTAEAAEAAFARLKTTSSLEEACGKADFVIEAVVELLEVKRQVFAELDRLAPAHAILATNSSYLGNSRLADATGRPDKVINMHFFYPPLVMQLVEVVRGEATSEETVELTVELSRRLGKVPVRVNQELPGFLVNRILRAITTEAYDLLDQGVASFEDIDLACELGLNHPMGPFRLGDFSGLDIGYNARVERYRETGDERYKPSPELEKRVLRGDVGRKSGRGFYDYSAKPPEPIKD